MPEPLWLELSTASSPASSVTVAEGTLDVSGFANATAALSVVSGAALDLGVGNLLRGDWERRPQWYGQRLGDG